MRRYALPTPIMVIALFCSLLPVWGACGPAPVPPTPTAKAPQSVAVVWPISGTAKPDFPLAATYGPRLQASEDYRYDFHRGIDIPVPWRSPVYAIADGQVRLAGDYSFYEDTLVQLSHFKTDKASCVDGGCYYSNYMHLSAVVVKEEQVVSQGQLIGYSGASASGFMHLHFEIRDGEWFQQNAIHPLVMLPYDETTAPQITINEVNAADSAHPKVKVTVTSRPTELDLNRVELFVYNAAKGELTLVDQDAYDMMLWNQRYTPQDAPYVFLDDPAFNGVEVRPASFNASSEMYQIEFTFINLNGVPNADYLVIQARASDIKGNFTEVTFP